MKYFLCFYFVDSFLPCSYSCYLIFSSLPVLHIFLSVLFPLYYYILPSLSPVSMMHLSRSFLPHSPLDFFRFNHFLPFSVLLPLFLSFNNGLLNSPLPSNVFYRFSFPHFSPVQTLNAPFYSCVLSFPFSAT